MANLAQYLVDEGLLSAADLEKAERFRATSSDGICAVLHRMALVEGEALVEAVSVVHDIPKVEHDDWPAGNGNGHGISITFMRNNRVFPLKETEQGIYVAIADPGDTFALDAIRLATERQVIPRVASYDEIESAIERAAKQSDGEADWGHIEAQDAASDEVAHLRDLALDTPVVRLVNDLLEEALRSRATDIHIEPFDGKLAVRMRVDGVLRNPRRIPAQMAKPVASRVKILAGLNIAERRLPQDGRSRIRIEGQQLDLRVATMPTIHGEAVAIRLLDNVRRVLDLGKLGFAQDAEATLRRQLAAPHGMLVVTGPTGSGKTTTLATALSILNETERKILTIEDPIEYEIEGVNQTQAKPEIGLTFAAALRSFLRHDPDVIMVGEMRDRETAQIGIHSALTGHLVLTTLHTNTASGAVARLLDMGVDAYLLASSLNGIVAQRLVRLLCPSCKEPYRGRSELPKASLAAAGIDETTTFDLWRARGCDRCAGTGYRDRIAITEILDIGEELRGLIKPGISAHDIEQAARRLGVRAMVADGLRKCTEGLTTVEEVRRVTLEL